MKTKVLSKDQIDEAVEFLQKGGLVATPTETVYGLAANAKDESAVRSIFVAKGRPVDHPLIVHVASLQSLTDWVEVMPQMALDLAQAFWPGPLTMIFKKREGVSDLITGGLDTIGVRMPGHPVIQKIIQKLGSAVVAPSANTHKKTSPTQLNHVLKTLEGRIDAVIDGGSCTVGLESTIVDMTASVPVVLRHGAITPSMIEKVIGVRPKTPYMHTERVAGNMEDHYQPKKPLYVLDREDLEPNTFSDSQVAIIHHSELVESKNTRYYKMPLNKADYAKQLYETLHLVDSTDAQKILLEKPPKNEEWADVNDRIEKASYKK